MEEIKNVNLTQLKPFKNHPFSVNFDKDFIELMKSIDKEGVIVPLLARPNPNGEGYELISGHRRKMVCEELGIEEIPVVIREMNDEQAIIAMVDINLMQREKIKLSEKAFALKMKLEAMSRQGQRSDLTSGQVDQKLKNRNVKTYGIEIEKKDNEELVFRNSEKTTNSYSSRKELAMQIGESERQIQRYIRLDLDVFLFTSSLDSVISQSILHQKNTGLYNSVTLLGSIVKYFCLFQKLHHSFSVFGSQAAFQFSVLFCDF